MMIMSCLDTIRPASCMVLRGIVLPHTSCLMYSPASYVLPPMRGHAVADHPNAGCTGERAVSACGVTGRVDACAACDTARVGDAGERLVARGWTGVCPDAAASTGGWVSGRWADRRGVYMIIPEVYNMTGVDPAPARA